MSNIPTNRKNRTQEFLNITHCNSPIREDGIEDLQKAFLILEGKIWDHVGQPIVIQDRLENFFLLGILSEDSSVLRLDISERECSFPTRSHLTWSSDVRLSWFEHEMTFQSLALPLEKWQDLKYDESKDVFRTRPATEIIIGSKAIKAMFRQESPEKLLSLWRAFNLLKSGLWGFSEMDTAVQDCHEETMRQLTSLGDGYIALTKPSSILAGVKIVHNLDAKLRQILKKALIFRIPVDTIISENENLTLSQLYEEYKV